MSLKKLLETKTVGEIALDIEREGGFDVSQNDYDRLNKIINTATERINLNDTPENILKTIYSTLEDLGFSYKEGYLFSKALRDKELNCQNSSIIYHTIGKKLGLSLKMISVPEHVLIRWVDEKNNFDWETTSGRIIDKEYYKKEFDIPDKSIKSGIYLKELSKDEIISFIYGTRGVSYSKKGDFDKAIENYCKAIELNPNFVDAYSNRGVSYSKKGDFDKAMKDINKAIELNPTFVEAYYNRGVVYFKLKEYDKAIKDFSKIIELNPKSKYTESCKKIINSINEINMLEQIIK